MVTIAVTALIFAIIVRRKLSRVKSRQNTFSLTRTSAAIQTKYNIDTICSNV